MGNIFLIGMMGSGKTTTAKELAELLGEIFVDVDRMIEDSARKSVSQIFSELGESWFRQLEKKVLSCVAERDRQVIATGGGVVLDPQNVHLMQSCGRIIYLKTSLDVLWGRVKDSKTRPLLKSDSPRIMLENLYTKRVPLYESAASLSVITDGKKPKQVAEELHYLLAHEKN